MPCRQNVQRRIVIGIGFKSASCTLEFCLRLSVLPVYATATTTRLARVLRRDDKQVPAKPCRLAGQLSPELEPALIQYGLV